MNCEEVQEYLSDLLDKSLGVERAEEIEAHLTSCSLCREEMARLAECRRLVSSLPEVEPPVGFANRVMTEVLEAAREPSFLERLFLPFKIKIPLQAAAVVLIAVLAAYIYQKEPVPRESAVTFPPESSSEKQKETANLAPSVTHPPSAASKTKEVAEETKPQVDTFKDSAAGREAQPLPRPGEQDKGIAGSLQENRLAKSEPASPRLEQSSASVESQAKGVSEPALQPETEIASKDAVASGKSLSSPEKREGSAASSLDSLRSRTVAGLALPADHELAVRPNEPGRNDKNRGDRLASRRAQAERHRSLTQEEAKNLEQAREQAIQTGQSQIVQVTVARNQYELFKKELADLGTIEMESSMSQLKNDAVSQSSDRIRIKVTILPPLASQTPAPSQPSSR